MLRKLFTNNIDNIKHIGYTTFVNAIRTNAINNIQELKEFGFNLREDINNAPFEDNAFQARLQPILLNLRVNAQQDIEPELKLKLELEGLYERLYNEIVLSVNEEVLYDKITKLSQNGSDVNINDLCEDLDSKLQMPSMVNTTQTTSNKNITAPNKSSLFGNKLTRNLARSFSTVEKEKLVPDATIIKKTPKISIGGDFKDLVTKSDVFVDKSLFIKEILEDPAEAILITMPRRWGKSLNLDMLKRFLSVQVDKDGKIIDLKITNDYKLFAGGEIDLDFDNTNNLKALKISTDDFCIKRQSQYPVIHVDFKDCKGSSLDNINGKLQDKLYKTVEQFSYLKNSEKEYGLSTIKETYLKLAKDIKLGKFEHSLKELSALLHAHHGKKVWLLIDEYDAATNKAYLEFSEADAKSVSELFRSIYEPALKGNEYLEKGMMTGVQYIVKSGMLSGLNNLSKYNVTDTKYSQYYGINQEEMDYLLTSFDISLEKDGQDKYTDDRAQNIKEWYNGYKEQQIDEDNQYNGKYIDKYNVWSVVKYLNDQSKFKSHWENSGNVKDLMQNILKNMQVQNIIEDMVIKDNPKFLNKIIEDFSVYNFKILQDISKNTNIIELDNNGIELFFSYLFITGYFTSKDNALYIPNNELKEEFISQLHTYYNTILRIDPSKQLEATKAFAKIFIATDNIAIIDIIKDVIGEKFKDIIKSLDINTSKTNLTIEEVRANEAQFEYHLSSIVSQVAKARFGIQDHTIKPDQSGGISDIWISKDNKGVVIEMKYQKGLPKDQDKADESARNKAKEALDQAKTYTEIVKDDPLKIFLGCNVTENLDVFISGSIEKEGQDAITFEYPPSC